MRKGCLRVLMAIFSIAGPAHLVAQQATGQVPRIRYLAFGSRTGTTAPYTEAFRQGLRELNYVEGKNLNVEYRFADGKIERLPELVEELVRLKIDILVVNSAVVAHAAKKSNVTLPIVVASMGDYRGLVSSFARPGGNVTGLTHISGELVGKRLELLKEIVPKVSRIALLSSADATMAKSMFNDAQGAAKAFGVSFQLVEIKVQNPDIEGVFRLLAKERVGALITEASGPIALHRKRILELVEKIRLPAMHSEQEWPNAGGLMSYGANRVELYRRAAVYVHKILGGAKPADLPVEAPMKFEFIANLNAAKHIGLTIPPNVLVRADRVIR